MNTQRKVPIRTCVSCRVSSEKKQLMRIVRTPDDKVELDPTGKLPGRGAYLCGSRKCLELALKANKLGRALRCEVPEQIRRKLEEISVKDDVEE